MAVDESQQVDNLRSRRKMFGEQIRRVDVSPGLPQFNRCILNPLLDPESTGINVTQLAQACSTTYADSGGRVRPYSEIELPAQIFHKGFVTKANS